MKIKPRASLNAYTIAKITPMNRVYLRGPTRVLSLGFLLLSLARAPAQNPGAEQICGINPLLDRSVALQLQGTSSTAAFRSYFGLYLVDASPDLADWRPLASLLGTNWVGSSGDWTNALTFIDTEASSLPQRFYRLPTNLLITPFPKRTGPYSVGTIARQLTDPSRTNRYNIKTNSSFMATFWYPAQAQAGQLPGPYLDPLLASYTDSNWGWPLAPLPLFVSHAFHDAPIATNDSPYPVIIYSHGYHPQGVRVENSAAATELASHGYIVVAIDHMDCYITALTNHIMLFGANHSTCCAFCQNPGTPWQSRLQDVQFLLGELSRLEQTDPVLANRLDLGHIGIMGWSFGGGTAAEACRTNDQIKAAVLLDARLDPSPTLLSAGLQKPFLAMTCPSSGTLSPQNYTLFGRATNVAYVLQILYGQPSSGCQLCGSPSFTDYAWIIPSAQSRQASQTMCACLVSFFNKHLKNLDDHLLDAPTNTFSNIVQFRKKP